MPLSTSTCQEGESPRAEGEEDFVPHPSSATRYPENTPPSPHTPVEHQCNPPPPSLSIAPLSSSESRGTQLQVRKPEYIEGATYVCLVNNEKGKGIYRPCLVNKVMANGFITFTEKGPDDKYNDWTGPVHEGVQAEDFDIHPASYHTIHKGSRRRAGGLPRYGTSRFHVLNWICDDEYSHSVTKAKSYINLFTGEWFQLKGVPNTVGIVLGFTRTNDSKYHTFLYCVCGTQPPTQVQKWVYKQTYTQEFGLLCQTVASTYLNAKVSGKPAQWLTDDQAHAIQQVIDAFRAVIDDDTGEKSYTPPHRYFVNIKQLTTEEEEPPSLSAKRKRQISASINSPSIPSAPKSTIVSQPPTPAATSTMLIRLTSRCLSPPRFVLLNPLQAAALAATRVPRRRWPCLLCCCTRHARCTTHPGRPCRSAARCCSPHRSGCSLSTPHCWIPSWPLCR